MAKKIKAIIEEFCLKTTVAEFSNAVQTVSKSGRVCVLQIMEKKASIIGTMSTIELNGTAEGHCYLPLNVKVTKPLLSTFTSPAETIEITEKMLSCGYFSVPLNRIL